MIVIICPIVVNISHQFIKEIKMKVNIIFEAKAKYNETLQQLHSLQSVINQTTQQ